MRDGRLFLWPKVDKEHPKILTLKQVVLDLDVGFPVRPFFYEGGVSADVSRVLVMADDFEWSPIVDYIRPIKKGQLPEAVRWALGLTDSRGARTALDTMTRIFGEGLTMRIEKEEPEDDGEQWLD
ncbi:hypothetical protein SEA_PAVLO_62 [Microbacterium phage Pavlo]|nr:hypothetical protein SEA_PAVLO_62 [Microbacterium phage Pavlo]